MSPGARPPSPGVPVVEPLGDSLDAPSGANPKIHCAEPVTVIIAGYGAR